MLGLAFVSTINQTQKISQHGCKGSNSISLKQVSNNLHSHMSPAPWQAQPSTKPMIGSDYILALVSAIIWFNPVSHLELITEDGWYVGLVQPGCRSRCWSTIGTLDPIGHGHSIASNILATFGNPVLSCKHSGESPFQLSWDLWK